MAERKVYYKGFDKDMKCRGFQFEEGKSYETDEAKLCEKGFHACECPLDVFYYYAPCDDNGNIQKFHEVALEGVSLERKEDSKVCAKKITVGAELNFFGIAKAHVEWVKSQSGDERANTGDYSAATNTGIHSATTNTGDYSAATNTGIHSATTNTGFRSAATNTGFRSAATNTGFRSAATNTGNYSAATNTGIHSATTNTGNYSAATNTGIHSATTNTGFRSAATNTGFRSAATNTGNYSAATNTGDYSAATNTGDYSAATNTGDYSAATNTGDCSAATNTGKDAIAIAWGRNSKASAGLGSYIVIAEYDDDGNFVAAKMGRVDGKRLKPNVFYKLVGGKFIKADEEETK